jgi:hypothetical protein
MGCNRAPRLQHFSPKRNRSSDYWISLAAAATLALDLLVVVISAWLPPRGTILDLLIPAGASLAFVCFLAKSLIVVLSNPFVAYQSALFCYLGMALGVFLSAFGFLMVRLALRKQGAVAQPLPGSF